MSDYFEYKSIKVKRRKIIEETKFLIPKKRFFILENEQVEEILYGIQRHEEDEPWNMLLVGEPGCGKSEMVMYLCAELDIPLVIVQGDSEMSVSDLVGFNSYSEQKGGMFWQDGKIPYGLRNRCSFLFDELPGILPDVLMKTYSMLDDRRTLDLKEHITEREVDSKKIEIPEMVSVPPETIFFGTSNPWDTGRHTGLKGLSPALDSRFGLRINMGYLSAENETKMLVHETGITEEEAKKIVVVANESRKAFYNQEICSPICHRQTKAWAKLAKKFGLARACKTTILSRLDEQSQDVLRGVLLAYNLEKPAGREEAKRKK
jgi:MoxR-like ATPase